MSKIKVLHIITRLDKGGSADSTLLTVSRLNKEKFNVTLISGYTNDPDGEIANLIMQKNLNYILIPDLVREIRLLEDIKVFYRLYHFIKEKEFDIVHTSTSKAGILGRWAAKLAGVKLIVHSPQGHIFYGYFGWCKTKLFLYLERLTGQITDRIITLTQRGKEEHLNYKIAKPNKFVPIYDGIEVERFANFQINIIREKERLGIPLNAPVIGTVTRLEPVKGSQYFIASLPNIVKISPALRVFIVGDGSERRKLERYVERLGLSENVIFTGQRRDIRGIVSIFDIFVLSSLNEGMGVCLLEAQALGVPVVATKVGGVPEVVLHEQTGILIPSKDPQALAQAVISLLKDKGKRQRMSKEAKNWIDNNFSVEAMVNRISNLYEELTKSEAI